MPTLTDEQQAESNKRVEEFKTKMLELSESLQVDLFSYPQFMQNPDGSFHVAVFTNFADKKYLPTKSPLSDEMIKG